MAQFSFYIQLLNIFASHNFYFNNVCLKILVITKLPGVMCVRYLMSFVTLVVGAEIPGVVNPSRPMLPNESSSVEVVDVDCRFTV